jgi:hypothetical protein
MWEDIESRKHTGKPGYRKVQGFVAYMKTHLPLVKWLWIDTCCIKQQSDRELSAAINSMFQWYRDAEVCLAYLEDVPLANDAKAFADSVWFRRGWTLQELLAPCLVVFLSQDWHVIGHKGLSGQGRSGVSMQTGPSLEEQVSTITDIPQAILHNYQASEGLMAEEKLAWVDGRQTLYGEDLSYCLLGVVGVTMNIRYGDGKEVTRQRLMRKIAKRRGMTAPGEFSVPFSLQGIPATDYFVSRDVDMRQLTDFFASQSNAAGQQRVFVVRAMGGMGKTQLCAEFVKTHAAQFSAVFWLDGSSKDSLLRSMATAASRLPQISQATTAPADVAELSEGLLRWLSLEGNTKWLIVIDNIDRDWQSKPPDVQAYDYRQFLPLVPHGSVLITTRLRRLQRPNASLCLEHVSDELAKKMIEVRAGRMIEGIGKANVLMLLR